MGYYWVTQAQRYIQSLGFGSTLPAVNKRQQLLRINQFGGDNSFYREGTGKLTITLGKGGVDDAEDAEVIVHEYGHSVQDNQVPGFGSDARVRRHRRGLRRLPRRDRLRALRADRRRAVRRRLGLDVVHLDGAALPASRRRQQALPGGPRRRGPRGRRDLVACAVGHPQARWAPSWPTRSSSARSSASRPTSRCRAAADDDRNRGPLRCRPRSARRRRRSPHAGWHSAHAPLQRQGRPRRGGEDQRDHGRQRYRPARVRTDRPARRRRDERRGCSTSSPTSSSSAGCRATRSRPIARTCCSSAPSWAAAGSTSSMSSTRT